jgi:hypothetical protein
MPSALRKGKTNRIKVSTTRINNENRESTVFRALGVLKRHDELCT